MLEKTINGKQVTITKFGAIEGWKLLHKLSSTLGPALTEVANDNLTSAMEKLFDKMDDTELIRILTQLLSVCLIDGKKVDFNRDCADYLFTLELAMDVVKYNFQEFFLATQEVIGSTGTKPG